MNIEDCFLFRGQHSMQFIKKSQKVWVLLNKQPQT